MHLLRNKLEPPKEFHAMQCLFSKLSSVETSREQATRNGRLLKPLCAETWNWYCLFSAFILILHSFELSFYWLNKGWEKVQRSVKALLRTYWALKSWGLKTSLYATHLFVNFDEVAKLQIMHLTVGCPKNLNNSFRFQLFGYSKV